MLMLTLLVIGSNPMLIMILLQPSLALDGSYFYAGCPIIWASRLQTQVALSTTKAEYIALSQSLHDVIPVMSLVTEVKSKGFSELCTEPYVYYKLFEDNSRHWILLAFPRCTQEPST